MYLYFCASSVDKKGGPSNSDFWVDLPLNRLRNIKSVEVVKVSIPNKNSVTAVPYLILSLDDLFNSGSIDGTYTTIIDTQPRLAGQAFIATEPRHIFEIPAGSTNLLTRISVKILDPNRNTFIFTPVNNDLSDTVNVFLRFAV